MTVGSSVAITACGLARLGTATAIVGVVGEDAFGDFMLAQLSSRGVDVTAVRTVPDGRTGSSVVLVRREDASDRHVLTDPGVMGDLRAGDLDTSALDRVRHLHIGSWFLHLGAVAELPDLLAEARRRGALDVRRPERRPRPRVGRPPGPSTAARGDLLLQRVRGPRGSRGHRVVQGRLDSRRSPSPAAEAGTGGCCRAEVRCPGCLPAHQHLGAPRRGAGGLSSFAGREWRRASMPQAPEDVPSRRRGFPMGRRGRANCRCRHGFRVVESSSRQPKQGIELVSGGGALHRPDRSDRVGACSIGVTKCGFGRSPCEPEADEGTPKQSPAPVGSTSSAERGATSVRPCASKWLAPSSPRLITISLTPRRRS